MRFLGPATALLAAALASGCVTAAPPPAPVPSLPPAPPLAVRGASLASLPGWAQEDHAAALAAFRQGCGSSRDPGISALCAELRVAYVANPRAWLDQRLVAVPVEGSGLLTGYFAPEYPARRRPDAEFSAPVRARPADLTADRADPSRVFRIRADGQAEPYPERAAIEGQPPSPDQVLAWMRPEDLFFLQIQGSGSLQFEDGSRRRAAYAAHNGRPFVGIARPMRERGLLADHQTSAANIRAWLAARRGPEADALMRENPRYVFFRLEPDDGGQPRGAASVPLPAGRAIAVDPAHHAYGQAFWIEADAGALAGAFPRYRRLVTALDTGGAIKGAVRADLYIGRGEAAGLEAGRIRHDLRMWRLVPR